jgi:hypothetical protein
VCAMIRSNEYLIALRVAFFGRLARAMATDVIFLIFKSKIIVRISIGLAFLNNHNYGPSMIHEV